MEYNVIEQLPGLLLQKRIMMQRQRSGTTSSIFPSQKKPNQNLTIDDQHPNYTLITELKDDMIFLNLKCFDLEQQLASSHSLILDNFSLNPGLKFVFGSVNKLYHSCFDKKENYEIVENGRIVIKCKVNLESEEIQKQNVLELIFEEKNEKELYKYMISKVKQIQISSSASSFGVKAGKERKLFQRKEKLWNEKYYWKRYNGTDEEILKLRKELKKVKQAAIYKIKPIYNPITSKLFQIDKKRIKYISNTDETFTMIALSTKFLSNSQQFDMTVQLINKCQVLLLGIISEDHVQEKSTFNNNNKDNEKKIQSIFYCPHTSSLHVNGLKIRKDLGRVSDGRSRIRMKKGRQRVQFEVVERNGESWSFGEELKELKNCQILPYIELYYKNAEVSVTLNSKQ